ncbi:hypothetical protein LPTSP4_01000 [Leptospira ryugenii]|uniref:Uncharacterized protein n=1 Tax=Leptospira ryugenii TaxID=1917863 RepID=A0A2P2DVK5_9LEPT|nr:hypothetical protein [Leptospira ryugenii]GBF48600.1 hypothetical protein LPTSP4_01000 [Leptospira ryugenii]
MSIKIKELFTLSFKKPGLSQEESGLEEKKKAVSEKLEAAFSRAESLEILNANSKWEDANLLVKPLAQDCLKLYLMLNDKNPGLESNDLQKAVAEVTNVPAKLKLKLEYILNFERSTSFLEAKDLERTEGLFTSFLNDLERLFSKKKRAEWNTALSKQKRIWNLQFLTLFIVLFSVSSGTFYYKIRFPKLASTDIRIYALNEENPGVRLEHSAFSKINVSENGNWVTYEFIWDAPILAGQLRIDPTEQARIRIQLKELQLFDEKGSLVFSHSFIWGADLLPENKFQYGSIHELKNSGKPFPGKEIELESLGTDPALHLLLPRSQKIKKATLVIRHTEIKNQFK